MQNKNISLADLFIRYGVSSASEEENRRLAEMSDENFMAIPNAQRSDAWYAHCIKRVPAYIYSRGVMDAIHELKTQSLYSGDARREKTKQIVGGNPQLYTPPFPIAWFEADVRGGHIRKVGYLLEQLPNGKPGLKASLFFYSIKYGVMPQRGKHILTQHVTRSMGGELSTTTYQNNEIREMSYADADEKDKVLMNSALDSLYLAMVLKKGAPIVKFIDPEQSNFAESPQQSSETISGKPLGSVELIGAGTALKFDVAKALTGPAELKVEQPQKLITAPTVVADEAEPLFVNEIFQRLAKISLYKKETRVSPYRPGTSISPEASIRIEKILRQVENNLINAMPYRFNSDTVLSICGDGGIDVPNDMVLPSPLTWIDNCTGEVDERTTIGALLNDQNDGKIKVTLFIEQVQDYNVQASLAKPEWEQVYADPALAPLLKKFEAFGEHEEPLFIVSNIVFDKNTGAVSFSGDDTLPVIYESAQRLPLVDNYNQVLVRDKEGGLDKDDLMNIMHIDRLRVARASLVLAQALAKKDPRIKIDSAQKPKSASKVVSIGAAKVPQRTASVVTLNPENVLAGKLPAPSPVPKFDFTHQIHSASDWYINNQKQLRPLASLIGEKEIDLVTIHAFTPVLTSRDLVSASAMRTALQGWHERAMEHVKQGFTVGKSHEEAIELLQTDLRQYQERIPDYISEYQGGIAAPTETSDSTLSVHELVASALKNERLLPLPFSTMLAHFGTRFLVTNDQPSFAGKNVAVIGSDFMEDMPKADLALHSYLSQIVIRIIGAQLSEFIATSKQADKLITSNASVDEVKHLVDPDHIREKRNLNTADAIGLLHTRQPQEVFSAPFYRYIYPNSMDAYSEFINLATIAAITIRPDLNEVLERARVACISRDDEETLISQRDDNLLSHKPITLKKPDSFGTPSEESVNALKRAYEDMAPSLRHFYSARPVGFTLAGQNESKYASALEIDAGQSGLLIGSGYLDPIKIRQWFTGIPLKPGQPVTIEDLDEDAIRSAASKGLIKGSLYAIRTYAVGRSPDIGTKFVDTELRSRLHTGYVDSALKQMIVASIIGEICAVVNDTKLLRKFQGCADFTRVASKELDGWSRELIFEHEPAMPSGSSSFTINRSAGVLTSPQINFFETMNALMREMRITPADLDSGFQFEAFKIFNWLNGRGADVMRASPEPFDPPDVMYKQLTLLDGLSASERQPLISSLEGYEIGNQNYQGEKKPEVVESMDEANRRARAYHFAIGKNFYVDGFGLPGYATSLQRSAYDKVLAKRSSKIIGENSLSSNNILQIYASGQNLLGAINEDDIVGSFKTQFPRPPFSKIFELAAVGAVDAFIKQKYLGEPPNSIQQLRSELQNTFSVPAIANRHQGLVFLGFEELSLVEKQCEIDKFQKTVSGIDNLKRASKEVLSTGSAESDAKSSDQKLGKDQKEDGITISNALNGAVIQRIFREAGKSHPNNPPEREDDIARMKWLEKQLRAIGELII